MFFYLAKTLQKFKNDNYKKFLSDAEIDNKYMVVNINVDEIGCIFKIRIFDSIYDKNPSQLFFNYISLNSLTKLIDKIISIKDNILKKSTIKD